MPVYRLAVVGISDGQFLVSYYHKIPNEKVDGIVEVIGFMSGLELSTLKPKPYYKDLHPGDQKIIEGARQTIIRDKLALERTVDSST